MCPACKNNNKKTFITATVGNLYFVCVLAHPACCLLFYCLPTQPVEANGSVTVYCCLLAFPAWCKFPLQGEFRQRPSTLLLIWRDTPLLFRPGPCYLYAAWRRQLVCSCCWLLQACDLLQRGDLCEMPFVCPAVAVLGLVLYSTRVTSQCS